MYQNVIFYDNARLGHKFACQFKSERAFEDFLAQYRYYGEIDNFNFDWADIVQFRNSNLLLRADDASFEKVLHALYPPDLCPIDDL